MFYNVHETSESVIVGHSDITRTDAAPSRSSVAENSCDESLDINKAAKDKTVGFRLIHAK